jgi:hypothetical protein
MLVWDPDSYKETRVGALKQFMPHNKIIPPKLSDEEVKEWFELY